MKKTILLVGIVTGILLSSSCNSTKKTTVADKNKTALSSEGIVLVKGQKITATSTTFSETDMGMGMEMKSSTTSTNDIAVISADGTIYSLSNTPRKINISMDMMGQQSGYDSEKGAGNDSELGKELSKKLNKADTLEIDRNTGKLYTPGKKKSPEKANPGEEENPLAGLMGAMGTADGGDIILESAFFMVPKGKKTGDTWSDSTSFKNSSSLVSYTIKSIENDIATILVSENISGKGETEMQGTTINFNMNSKKTGEVIVDLNTGLVNRLSNQTNLIGTMDLMGKSMPISSKATSTVVYK